MSLTSDQLEEVQKLVKLEKQFEGIMRTTRNAEQLQRNGVELKKIRDRLAILCPDGVPASLRGPSSSAGVVEETVQLEVLNKFPVEKASAHSEDKDVNLLSTILKAWEEQFTPALSESHLKLDFSTGAERDAFYIIFESIKRQKKVYIDTLEDYANATREDVKAQLRDMKSRYMRNFLQEGATYLKKLSQFWQSVSDDLIAGGSRVMNKEDKIIFNRKFENSTFFDQVPIRNVLVTTAKFLRESCSVLNIPMIPSKDD